MGSPRLKPRRAAVASPARARIPLGYRKDLWVRRLVIDPARPSITVGPVRAPSRCSVGVEGAPLVHRQRWGGLSSHIQAQFDFFSDNFNDQAVPEAARAKIPFSDRWRSPSAAVV